MVEYNGQLEAGHRYGVSKAIRDRSVTGLLLLAFTLNAGCVSKTKHELALAEGEQLSRTMATLQNDLAASRAQQDELAAKLKTAQAELDNANKTLKVSNQELSEVNESITRRNKQVQELLDKIAAAEAELKLKEAALEDATARASAAEALAKRTHDLFEGLVSELGNELAANEIKIEEMKDGIKLNLSENILFPSGSAKLSANGEDVIKRVSERIRESAFKVEVAGHTDNVPIKSTLAKLYPTNWELAAARAASVVKVLEGAGVDPLRLMAVSMGQNHPVAPNDTPEGRALNRRIEIRLRE